MLRTRHSLHRRLALMVVLAGLSMFVAGVVAAGGARSDRALLLQLKGSIGPASSAYVLRGLAYARAQKMRVVILRIDTPGGLDTSMRAIIQAILASPVPVVSYVSPGGARAASAGTYILYASHIAAMAPGTNVGAATPVQLGAGGSSEANSEHGSTMERKMVNDAVAYIRSLAKLRRRNADWAEQAVRGAASLPADQALKMDVIDVVADNVAQLLHDIDGRSVMVQGRLVVLHTGGLHVQPLEPDWHNRLLATITDPNVAYVLMLIGIYGLFFELVSPGHILPGVAGAICLILALYAFQTLPVNYAGLALILLGVGFMVAEAFVPSFGALGIGGVIAFVTGSILLMDTDSPLYRISRPLIFGVAIVSAGLIIALMTLILRARRRPLVSGSELLIGALAEVVDSFDGRGLVRIQGEIWQACGAQPLRKGEQVRVIGRDGLVLKVASQSTPVASR